MKAPYYSYLPAASELYMAQAAQPGPAPVSPSPGGTAKFLQSQNWVLPAYHQPGPELHLSEPVRTALPPPSCPPYSKAPPAVPHGKTDGHGPRPRLGLCPAALRRPAYRTALLQIRMRPFIPRPKLIAI